MLIRRARAYGSSCSHVILVYTDVDISKKLVVNACYNKRHVCAYLQPSVTLFDTRVLRPP